MSANVCSACATENFVGATTCSICGAALSAKRKRIPKWLWISAGIAACLLAIPCMGLIATLVVPVLLGRFEVAQRKKAEIDIAALAQAVEVYQLENGGACPESLEALVTPDEVGRTILRGYTSVPLDPWKNAYHYEAPHDGGDFRIFSYGGDGQPGGEGQDADIDNESLRRK